MKRTPIKRTTWLNRKTPMKQVNGKRKAKMRVVHYTAEMGYDAWIRDKDCAVCGRDNNIEAAHVISRGAGGTAEHMIPLCCFCHRDQHQWGWLPDNADGLAESSIATHKGVQITKADALELAASLWALRQEELGG